MAIIIQQLTDGRTRTYSDQHMMIRCGDNMYSEAIELDDMRHEYEETDVPIEGYEPMKYSTLQIKRKLNKIGKWESTKRLLEDNGFWDDFILANYLSEDDEVFKTACSALTQSGIITQQQLIGMLANCVWTPDIGVTTI